jgi:hypothetical protein
MLSSWTWGTSDGPKSAISSSSTRFHRDQPCRTQRSTQARSIPNRPTALFHSSLDILERLQCHLYSLPEDTLDVRTLFGEHSERITWEAWPSAVHPIGGDLPLERQKRKQEQIESLLLTAIQLINQSRLRSPSSPSACRRLRVVEFCGGSGHIALPLACIFPSIEIVLIDIKSESIARACKRVSASHLEDNVRIIQGDIRDFHAPFDLGIALHACGIATDIVLQKCVEQLAAFVLCPCCVGKVLPARTEPLSQRFRGQLSPVSVF